MSSDSGQASAVRTIGRYRAFDELGRGAMGVVYRGFDPVIGRTVALKTLLLDSADAQMKEFRDRLYREAAAAGALSHPNIVTIFDIVEEGGTTAVAMEFIEGQSLASIIADRGPLALDVALDFLEQLCSALDFAGSHGVIHRDIKPANILITPSGRAKVTDFGVARLAMSTATQAGTVLGSPSYMSPEQVRGLTLDGRSDLFSAAVVFYEMITKQRPFAGNDIATTMYRIAHDPPIPPEQFNATLSHDITIVLERALAKNPDDRFQTGLELAAALQHAAGPQAGPATALAHESGVAAAASTRRAAALASPSVTQAAPASASPSVTRAAPASASGPAIPVGMTDANGMTLPPIPMTASGSLLPIEAGPPPPSVPPFIPPIAGTLHARPAPWRRPVIIGLGVAAAAITVAVALVFIRSDREGPQALRSSEAVAVPATPLEPATPSLAPQPATPDKLASSVPAPVAGALAAATPQPVPSTAATPMPVPPAAVAPQPVPPAAVRPKPARPAPAGTGVRAPGATSPPIAPPVEPPVESPVESSARPRRAPLGRVYNPTEVDVRPQVLRQVAPSYPASAERAGTEDVVVVKVLIGPDGQVADIQILRGSLKYPGFDSAARSAVRQWVFAPARKGGEPVASWFNVGVPFQLKR